jgi:hypothetical protein
MLELPSPPVYYRPLVTELDMCQHRFSEHTIVVLPDDLFVPNSLDTISACTLHIDICEVDGDHCSQCTQPSSHLGSGPPCV